jgi:hypothetical protein
VLAESGGVDGYQLTDLTCTPVAENEATLTVSAGDDITCTFTNTAEVGLQVTKTWNVDGITYADGTKKSVGVVLPAALTFNTGAPEIMECVAGGCEYKLAGTDAFVPALSSLNELYGTPIAYLIAAAVLASVLHSRRDVLVLIALAAVVSGLGEATTWGDAPLRIALAAAGFGLLAWLVRPYARVSFTSWLLAGLFSVVADGLLRGLTASTATSAAVALVPAVVAAVILMLVLRRPHTEPFPAPGP